MVYGVGGNPSDRSRRISFEDRVKSWRDRGYTTHFMTGIAWGEYQEYFTGKWDGQRHLDEGQVTAKGDTIWHGHLVPYIVPSDNYLKYIKEKHVKRVIDAGVEAIFMEEAATARLSSVSGKNTTGSTGDLSTNPLRIHIFPTNSNTICTITLSTRCLHTPRSMDAAKVWMSNAMCRLIPL